MRAAHPLHLPRRVAGGLLVGDGLQQAPRVHRACQRALVHELRRGRHMGGVEGFVNGGVEARAARVAVASVGGLHDISNDARQCAAVAQQEFKPLCPGGGPLMD
jgi:hypothetical protein